MNMQIFLLSILDAVPNVLAAMMGIYIVQPLFKDTGVSHAVWYFKTLPLPPEMVAQVEAEALKYNKKAWESAIFRLGLGIVGAIILYFLMPMLRNLILQ
jgi:hypothetical protein